MDLRQALKSDVGIEVLVAEGEGLRTSPWVIEPCSADDATRTQLNVFRGLCRGRRELWRLLQAEPAVDVGNHIHRLRIETISFTADKIFTETRAYYFDVSHVHGTPNAATPPPAWSDTRVSFTAAPQIGWLHFDQTIDNSRDQHLDVTLLYSGWGAKAAIYVYEPSDRPKLQAPFRDVRESELSAVCDHILTLHPTALTPWQPHLVEPFLLRHLLIQDDMSVAGVAVDGAYFVKLRLTYFDDIKMRSLMNETIAELCSSINRPRALI